MTLAVGGMLNTKHNQEIQLEKSIVKKHHLQRSLRVLYYNVPAFTVKNWL